MLRKCIKKNKIRYKKVLFWNRFFPPTLLFFFFFGFCFFTVTHQTTTVTLSFVGWIHTFTASEFCSLRCSHRQTITTYNNEQKPNKKKKSRQKRLYDLIETGLNSFPGLASSITSYNFHSNRRYSTVFEKLW